MVRAGYKQTEVGEIPEDWIVSSLGKVCTKITDGTHDTPKPVENGIPYLTAIHVKPNRVNFDDCYYLPLAIHNDIYRRCNPEKNDVLMVNIGAGVATTALVTVDYEFSLKNVALLKPDTNEVIGGFLNQYQLYRKERIVASLLSGGAQPFLALGQISKIKLAHPFCTKEQKAIAEALSDVDGLIGALEKQIAKKRNIKTATMQQLLTGKKRLPGFGEGKGYRQTELGLIPEDWDVETIGKCLSITTGSRNTQDKTSDGQYPFYVRSQTVERINSYSFDGEGVLTAGDGVGTGKIFHYVNGKIDFHQRVYLMHNFSGCLDAQYFFIFFREYFYARIMSMTAKSSVDSVRREMIADMPIFLPTPKEQEAISTVLFGMDSELEALETKLSKTKAIKQGMMQDLLTGRTRLI